MKIKRTLYRSLVRLGLAVLVIADADAATMVWSNVTGGNWSVAANWEPNQVPGPADHAVITNDGVYAVQLDLDATVGSLLLGGSQGQQSLTNDGRSLTLGVGSRVGSHGTMALAGGTLGGGHLAVNGRFVWTGGTYQYGSLTIETNATLNVSGAADKTLVAAGVTNLGTVIWTGAGGLVTRYTSHDQVNRIINRGVFEVQTDAGVVFNPDWYNPVFFFENAGTWRKSGSTGTNVFWGVPFHNTGEVEVQTGAVRLTGGGNLGGESHLATDTVWELAAGGFSLGAGATFRGNGVYRVTGGTVSSSGGADFDRLEVLGGNVANQGTVMALTLAAPAAMGGANRVTGVMNWTGGTYWGGLTIASNATLNVSGAADKTMVAAGVTNLGTVIWTGAGGLVTRYTSHDQVNRIINRGVFEVQTDAGVVFNPDWYNPVFFFENAGTWRKSGTAGTTAVGATFLNSGVVEIESGGVALNGGGVLRFDGDAYLSSLPGTTLRLSALSLAGTTTNASGFSPKGQVVYSGGGMRALEVMSQDRGNLPAGFIDNFAYGTIELVNGASVTLVDDADNSPGRDVLYVENLSVGPGCSLDLSNVPVYVRSSGVWGTLTGGTLIPLPNSPGSVTIDVPSDGALAVPGEVDEWTFFARAGQMLTVAVETGGARVPVPQLSFAEVCLFDVASDLVGCASNAVASQAAVLAEVVAPVDGIYRIKISAPSQQPSCSGNYRVGVWEVTPDITPLVLNETMHGRIETPYSIDHWTFSAAAGQQVRFDLVNTSAPGLAFTLRGPGGAILFTNLVDDSELVNLPQDGGYTLSAVSTEGDQKLAYAFRLTTTSQFELGLETAFTGSFTGSLQAQIFRVDLPDGGNLRITLKNNGVGNQVQLYAARGAPPTLRSFWQRSEAGVANSPQLLISGAPPGTWYILVYGEHIPVPTEFILKAERAGLFLTEVYPGYSGGAADVLLSLGGAGFDSTTRLELVASNGIPYPVAKETVVSRERMTATIASNSVPGGRYTLRVWQPDGDRAELANAFELISGGKAGLMTRLILPSFLGYHMPATLYIEYANTGSVTLPAPLLCLRSTDPEGDERPLLTLDANRAQNGFWSAVLPAGFDTKVQLLAGGAIPGWLNPGESARVPVYYTGMQQPWNFGDRVFEFDIRVLTGDDGTPIDWAGLKNSLRPEWISPESWDPVYANLTNQVGPTWGDYAGRLQENARYLFQLGQSVVDVQKLWAFELEKARGLRPVPTLANTIDLAVAGKGLWLGLNRVYPTALDRRGVLGPFGRGWATFWSASVRVAPDGTVLVVGAGGDVRRFEPDSRGGYLAPAGESSVLRSLNGGGFRLEEADGTAVSYQPNGKLESIRDANGNTVTAVYSSDRLVRLTHSDGQSLAIAYNGAGRITEVADSAGRSAVYGYDATSEFLVSVRDFRNRTTRYTYFVGVEPSRNYALATIELPDGVHESYEYDGAGRLRSVWLNEGAPRVDFQYDALGAVTASNRNGSVSRTYFDHTGGGTRIVDASGYSVLREFDGRHQTSRITDSEGRADRFSYACCGLVTSRTDALGQEERFSYTRFPVRLASATDRNGNTTYYSYDPRGNLIAVTSADNRRQFFSRDAQGQLAGLTNRNGQWFRYERNGAGRVTREESSDASPGYFAYDAKGQLLTASNRLGEIRMRYDPNGRLTNIAFPEGRALTFEYDGAGRRVRMTDQIGFTIGYEYDRLGRLQRLKDGAEKLLAEYSYDDLGRVQREAHGNGTYTTWLYDAAGRVIRVANHAPDDSTNSRFAYAYDSAGRVTSAESLEGRWDYTYDAVDQLVRAVFRSKDPMIPDQDLAYTYDAAGNRLQTRENEVATGYTVNRLNQYSTAGEQTLRYDEEGNLVEQRGTNSLVSFSYDARGRLTQVEEAGSVTQYEYDALGNRCGVVRDGERTEYLYDPTGLGSVVGEYDSAGKLKARYVNGLDLLCRVGPSGEFHYYDSDEQGSTTALTGEAGTNVNRYAYRPYGELLGGRARVENPFCYLGSFGVMTEPTGLLWVRARYYSPALGRFCAPDPLGIAGGDLNLYRYAVNSPLAVTDITGEEILRYARTKCKSFLGLFRYAYTETWGDYEMLTEAEQNCVDAHEAVHKKQCRDGKWGDTKESCYKNEQEAFKETLDCMAEDIIGNRESFAAGARGAAGDAGAGSGYGPCDELPSEPPAPPSPPGGAGASGSAGGATAQDPNAKTGPGGFGSTGFVEPGRLTPYRVDFENEATASAPAQEVVIRDRLSGHLDWTRFEWTEVGWGDQWIGVPPGRRQFSTNVLVTCCGAPFEVQVDLSFSLATGEATAIFRSIDPDTGLPPAVEVGFLPPENGTGRGQGHISFLVQALPDLPTGAEIRNVAWISFDGQPDITTNQRDPHDATAGTDPARECLNTIDASPPSSSVTGLPPQLPMGGMVRWSGTDLGSGIASYDIFVSENGGPWALWLEATGLAAQPLSGTIGHRYAFYSVALDYTGQREAAPLVADAETVLIEAGPSLIAELAGNQLRIRFVAESGKRYGLEVRTDLAAEIWEAVEGYQNLQGPGEQQLLLDLAGGATARFYRLAVAPGP